MIRNNLKWIMIALLALFALSSILPMVSDMGKGCQADQPAVNVIETKPLPDIPIPQFNSDSAYIFTEKIVSFGPRVVGTPGAAKVKKYVVSQFKQYGAEVIEQPFKANTYDGKTHAATNIIARYNLQATNRVVLSAHWDSRPFADKDTDPAFKDKPILGADDSGSSMGMLLEMARQLQHTPLSNLGIDIVFFDAEDYGNPAAVKTEEEERRQNLTWCLGSQYWAKNLPAPNYTAKYGINLDMAGAKGARFTKDPISMQYAAPVVEKVWRVAREKYGYVGLFVDEPSKGPMIDDHLFVNQIAKIPMIDIFNNPQDTFFGKYWHTHNDDMSVIDKETLRSVGQTVLAVLHFENVGAF